MSQVRRLLASSIVRKFLMAVTGLALIGFLVAHLAGNLLVFAGADTFNAYGHKLVSNPLIYVAEAGLLVLFVAHLLSGFSVTRQNRAARSQPYEVRRRAGHGSNKSLASTTMIFSGLVVLIFVPLHLWTFKFGAYHADPAHPGTRDLYRLVLDVFHDPLHVAWYVVAMSVVGFHLWHGFASGIETLGIGSRPSIRRIGRVIALAIAGGFAIVPIVIFLMRDSL